MEKQELNAIKQDVKKLKASLKKLIESNDKAKEKIKELQADIEENEKNIDETQKQIAEKEEILKKADYSPVLQKLDNAALNTLSKREAELLAEHILSGKIAELLSKAENVVTSNKDKNINIVTCNNEGTASNAEYRSKIK